MLYEVKALALQNHLHFIRTVALQNKRTGDTSKKEEKQPKDRG